MLFRNLAASCTFYAVNSSIVGQLMLQLQYLLLCKVSNTDLGMLLLAAKRSKAFLHPSLFLLPPSGKAAGLYQRQVFARGQTVGVKVICQTCCSLCKHTCKMTSTACLLCA